MLALTAPDQEEERTLTRTSTGRSIETVVRKPRKRARPENEPKAMVKARMARMVVKARRVERARGKASSQVRARML